MPNRIKKLLETSPSVKIVFDTTSVAHVFTNKSEEEQFLINVDEKEMVKQLNTEFKVFFLVTQSDHCRHVFNVRAKEVF